MATRNKQYSLSQEINRISLSPALIREQQQMTVLQLPEEEKEEVPAPPDGTPVMPPQFKEDYIFNINLPGKNNPAPTPAADEKDKKQRMLQIGIAVLAVLLILVFFLSTRKK